MNPRRATEPNNLEAPGEPGGSVRVVLLGTTGAEATLRDDAGMETVRARTPLEAVGEVASPPASATSKPVAVVIGPDGEPEQQSGAFLSAIRQANPSVRLIRVGRDGLGDASMYDAVLDEATGDAIRGVFRPASGEFDLIDHASGAVHEPRLEPLESLDTADTGQPSAPTAAAPTPPDRTPDETDRGEVVVTRARPAPPPRGHDRDRADHPDSAVTADTPEAVVLAGDSRLLNAMGESRSAFEDIALELIRERVGDRDVQIIAAEPGQGGTPIIVSGEPIGVLCGPRVDCAVLSAHAGWLGSWLTHFERVRSLRRAAFTDPLTGAWNRRYFDGFLEAALNRARANRSTVTVLVFDVDEFKQYNDRFGHPAGDEILIETVRALQSSVRPSDRVCRIGGDEFAVIFDEPDGPRAAGSRPPESVYTLAKRVQRKIAERKFPKLGADAPGSLTVSGGLAAFPWDGHDATTLLEKADQLACQSKRQGKNAITLGPGAERVCRGECDC